MYALRNTASLLGMTGRKQSDVQVEGQDEDVQHVGGFGVVPPAGLAGDGTQVDNDGAEE